MKHQVCVVSGTRADYGLLRPLLIRLRDCPEIELTIAATGQPPQCRLWRHGGGADARRFCL